MILELPVVSKRMKFVASFMTRLKLVLGNQQP